MLAIIERSIIQPEIFITRMRTDRRASRKENGGKLEEEMG
jgi:hypothetical protein